MTGMLAIRYVTLAALVVWLGGLVTVALLIVPGRDHLQQFQTAGFVCGAIVFVGLVVDKFVGPPPHDFFTRIGLVAAMLLMAIYPGIRSTASLLVIIGLGFVLLSWYVRE
jgi:hypothetical protein